MILVDSSVWIAYFAFSDKDFKPFVEHLGLVEAGTTVENRVEPV